MSILQRYLDRHKMKQSEFAAKVRVDRPLVSMWCTGRRTPGLDNAIAIAIATEGEIPATAWTKKRTKSGSRKAS